jgi:cardiolipin synthase A/B
MIEMKHLVEKDTAFRFAFKRHGGGLQWKETTGGKVMTSGTSGGLRNQIIQLISQANQQVCVCSFLLADTKVEEALLAATERGIRVYLLTSAEMKLKTSEGEDWERDDEIRELHKKMLERLSGKVYLRSSGHFHAKYIVADGVNGIMTTCNFTTKALLENPELGVRLEKTESQQVWKLFQYQFWEGSEKEMLRKGTLDGVQPQGRFLDHKPKHPVRCSFSTGQPSLLLKECLDLIQNAEKSIIVTSYGWGSKDITRAISERVSSGINVSIIGRNHRGGSQTEHLQRFKEMGCEVYGLPLIHAKSVLVDAGTPNARAIVMSANIDAMSMGASHELGICLDAKDTEQLSNILNDWTGVALTMVPKEMFSSVEGDLSVFSEKDGWRNLTVENETISTYDAIKAPSAELVSKAKPSFKQKTDVHSRVHKHHWTVEVPRLGKGAKEEGWLKEPMHDEEGNLAFEGELHQFPVFVLKNNTRVIAIESLDDAEAAAKYKGKAKAKIVVLR